MFTKNESDQALEQILLSLIQDEPDALANLANSAALIYHSMTDLNWAGFYLFKENQLILGPFQGKPACIRIPLGKGVCGTAAQDKKAIVVRDVHEFPGHIACDAASASEIVIPILRNGQLMGVLDIDSPVKARFGEKELQELQSCADVLAAHVRLEDLLG